MQHDIDTQNVNNVILLEAYTVGLKKVFELSQDPDTEEEYYIALETMHQNDIYNLAGIIQAEAKEDIWNDLGDDAEGFAACFNLDELQQFMQTAYSLQKALHVKTGVCPAQMPYALATFIQNARNMTDQDYATAEGHYAAHKAASDAVKQEQIQRKTTNPFKGL